MSTQPAKPQKSSSERVRGWSGPAILSYGYRPFFMGAGIWAVLAMLYWIVILSNETAYWSLFFPLDWHAHEMLFGYLGAVLAGFLLTAVPNWTGRLPIVGWPVAALFALWLLGRLAIGVSQFLSPGIAGVLDLLLPTALTLSIGREIWAGKNWRNLPLLALYFLFGVANLVFHVEAALGRVAAEAIGFRLGLGVAVVLLSLVGGRIIPSFTRNWLVKQGHKARPAPFNAIDRAALAVTLPSLAAWIIWPDHIGVSYLCAIAGVAHLVRWSRWAGWQTRSEPMLWILHLGYLFVPLGFLAVCLAGLGVPFSPMIGAQHLWMAGAIGVTSLAIMSRASLAHAGRKPVANRAITTSYCLVLASVVLRFFAAFGASTGSIMAVSALLWSTGFLVFTVTYFPILTKSTAKTHRQNRVR
ncbi:NnrS family protein [Aliiroseovarius lamellibrachiae]|uniref:NnrS family protein n=1 Tax=Aliiroseovarius lamellibrachiae TaxID=1924933 RepID=UPI001BE063FC|nr:NnrS family protein [Aliiroseovarius lamellibrachiae]MBT2130601.1 NnrS family protein [Aliiroseovarius lamellibrachiae]